MRITEIISNIYCYVATIKVKHGKSNTTTRTIIYADGISQARALLVASYGENSVLAISRITDSKLDETVPNRTNARLAPEPIPRVLPTTYTHKLAQNALVNQMKRNALHVKPTIDDLIAAQDKFEGEQKRIDREYDSALKDRYKWAEIRKRRNNFS
jgi:hypothetical protein